MQCRFGLACMRARSDALPPIEGRRIRITAGFVSRHKLLSLNYMYSAPRIQIIPLSVPCWLSGEWAAQLCCSAITITVHTQTLYRGDIHMCRAESARALNPSSPARQPSRTVAAINLEAALSEEHHGSYAAGRARTFRQNNHAKKDAAASISFRGYKSI